MSKFTGNIIRLPAITPSQSSASGVFTLDDQFTAQATGTWPILRDQYFNYTTLLLTGAVQGTTGPNPVTQPYSFLSDASTNNFVVSPNGDVSARAFNPYLNNYSNYFNGTSDYLSIADNAAFNFGTGDATVEFWFSSPGTTNNYPGIVSAVNYAATGVASIRFDNTGYKGKVFMYLNGGGDPVIASTSTVPYNVWTHVAIVRQGTSLKLYLNGSLDASVTISASLGWYLSNGGMRIGRGFDVDGAGGYYPGYLSNLRLVKGTAVYTAPFVPSTIPLQNITNTSLLTCQSNRFRDNSTANSGSGFTITPNGTSSVSQNSPFVSYDTTNGSGYFDGNGDYLDLGDQTAFEFGAGDYTVEFWWYPTSTANQNIVGKWDAGGSEWIIQWRSPGYYRWAANGTVISDSSTITLSVNSWIHIAIVKISGSLRIYSNGSQINTTASEGTISATSAAVTVGTSQLNTSPGYVTGYISDVRIIKGSGAYTGNFTPPIAPIRTSGAASAASYPSTTNVNTSFAGSATSLLTLQTRAPATNNGFVDSSPNNFVITRNGNTTQGTFTPFSPTGWSYQFNGSNNGFTVPASSAFSFAGEFTWEAFVCLNAIPGSGGQAFICGSRNTTASNSSFQFGIYNRPSVGTEVNITLSIGGTDYGLGWSITTPTIGVWYHVAVVRNASNTVSCYWDGSLKTLTQGSASAPGTINTPTVVVSVGYRGTPNNDLYLNGYISNLRMVASALYSGASITIPTAAFSPTVANTRFLTCQSNRFTETAANMAVTLTNSPSVQAFSPFAPASSYIPSVHGGSGYFDGTGSGTAADYLTAPDSPVFTLGSGDFTLETWVYSTLGSGADRYYIAHTDNATAAASQFAFYQRSADAFILFEYYVGATSSSITSGAAITLNQWNHIAVCRSNGTLSMFVNGVRPASGTTNISTTAFNDSASNLSIGGRTSGAALLTGNISGMRLVRGTDLYGASNTTITVPTAPPTPVTGTSLLLNFTNGGIVDATGKNNLETVGNSGVQTTVIKYGNGSTGFNGASGTYLNAAPTGVPLGSGDFVVECWVYLNASKAQGIFDTRATNTSTTGIALYLTSGNAWQMVINNAGVNIGGSITNLVWTHVAVVRTGSTIYVYVAGSLVNSSPSSNNLTDTTFLLGTLRDNADTTTTWKLNGYVDDFRITKGYNRGYSGSTITVPTGPFPLG